MRRTSIIVAGLTFLLLGGGARGGETIAGPVAAELVEVVDGDTIRVVAHVWLGQQVTVLVRIRGIDAPEVRGECAIEREGATAATAALSALVGGGALSLTAIEGDKYFGRVVADVATDGASLAPAMLRTGLVRVYDGGTREPWCPVTVAGVAG